MLYYVVIITKSVHHKYILSSPIVLATTLLTCLQGRRWRRSARGNRLSRFKRRPVIDAVRSKEPLETSGDLTGLGKKMGNE
jgi:hypothetical protein